MSDILPPDSPLRRKGPAPSIYCTMFSRDQKVIYAGGAGANQVRGFDYETGKLLFKLSDMGSSITSMDISHKDQTIAFGS